MDLSATYDYLARARRDLWTALENEPDELLSRPLLEGERFHCPNQGAGPTRVRLATDIGARI